MIAVQLLERFELIHSNGYIYRDVKPHNFMVGKGRAGSAAAGVVHVIDFGLAYRYRDRASGEHTNHAGGLDLTGGWVLGWYRYLQLVSDLTGTARYASINNHLGIQQTRRDDLVSGLQV
jgi:serine/threonine protein kinase